MAENPNAADPFKYYRGIDGAIDDLRIAINSAITNEKWLKHEMKQQYEEIIRRLKEEVK